MNKMSKLAQVSSVPACESSTVRPSYWESLSIVTVVGNSVGQLQFC